MSITTDKVNDEQRRRRIVSRPTHIRGLGLNDQGGIDEDLEGDNAVDTITADGTTASTSAATSSCGLVGQVSARQACGVVVDLIAAKKLAGRAVLSWVPRNGQSTRRLPLVRNSVPPCPFCPVAASTVYSKEVQRRKFSWNTFDERLDCGFGKTSVRGE
jgi:DNA helicase TIP49 (TBP-interacting protein)